MVLGWFLKVEGNNFKDAWRREMTGDEVNEGNGEKIEEKELQIVSNLSLKNYKPQEKAREEWKTGKSRMKIEKQKIYRKNYTEKLYRKSCRKKTMQKIIHKKLYRKKFYRKSCRKKYSENHTKNYTENHTEKTYRNSYTEKRRNIQKKIQDEEEKVRENHLVAVQEKCVLSNRERTH